MHKRLEKLVEIKDVCLSYGTKRIFDSINLEIHNGHRDGQTTGQIVSLLGPSGVGKTQLLRIVAGLQKPNSGEVLIGGKSVVDAGRVGVVLQKYPLFEHRTIRGNLSVVSEKPKQNHGGSLHSVDKYLEIFGLSEHSSKYPHEISGGMQQRVAICQQMLAMDCNENFKLLLLDEPFAALDPVNIKITCQLLRQTADLEDHNTLIVVTHDIQAALLVSDEVWYFDRNDNNKIKTVDMGNYGVAWDSRKYKQIEQIEQMILESYGN